MTCANRQLPQPGLTVFAVTRHAGTRHTLTAPLDANHVGGCAHAKSTDLRQKREENYWQTSRTMLRTTGHT